MDCMAHIPERELATLAQVASFAAGAIVASFLNVVVWRVPRDESIVSPPSHCPKCGKRLRWWMNVPIVSWLALRGKCAFCGKPVSVRYPLVEALGAFLFLAAFWRFGWFAPLAWVWLSLMLVGAFIDLDYKILPDFVTLGGIAWGLAVSAAFWAIGAFTPYHFHNIAEHCFFIPPLESLAGAALGLGLLWLVRAVGGLAFKREAMGMGDVLLMGAVGAISGPRAVAAVLTISAFLGSIAGLALLAAGRLRGGAEAREIPYGPFICAAEAIWLFCGEELWRWYCGLTGLTGFAIQ